MWIVVAERLQAGCTSCRPTSCYNNNNNNNNNNEDYYYYYYYYYYHSSTTTTIFDFFCSKFHSVSGGKEKRRQTGCRCSTNEHRLQLRRTFTGRMHILSPNQLLQQQWRRRRLLLLLQLQHNHYHIWFFCSQCFILFQEEKKNVAKLVADAQQTNIDYSKEESRRINRQRSNIVVGKNPRKNITS